MQKYWANLAVTAALAGMTLSGPAVAADIYDGEPVTAVAQPDISASEWQYAVAVYLWGAGLTGDVGIGSLPVSSVDASFGDIFDNLDFAFMAVAEARKDRYGIFGDLLYLKLSTDVTGPRGLGTASIESEVLTATLMAEYRVVEQGKTSVDLMAGARLWNVSGNFTATVSFPGGPTVGASGSGSETWVDPMIGVKTRVQGDTPWYFTGWAMIGGFGAAADIDWDLFGGAGYEFNDTFSLVVGYRAIGVDYTSSSLVWDVVEHGPVVGGVFRF